MNDDAMRHGAFSWFELMTTDVDGAKKFYGQLFGWETESFPMGDMDYTVLKVDGKGVGGMMSLPAGCEGMPPSWDLYVTVKDVDATAAGASLIHEKCVPNYVTVKDVDATAAAVAALGGEVLRPPMDIPGVGRFCVIRDPQGAVICAITYAED